MQKLLIANRGEIACRIIRTASRMGIATVAVHSEADAGARHVRLADEAVAIGPAPATESYLRPEAILAACRASGADAVHPGYGFLSENADFAQAVIDAGLTWVGPTPESMRVMGLKDSAKTRMRSAGVPVVPGYMGEDQGLARLERMAEMVGYPLLIKAVAGGGGKGMRPVASRPQFTEAMLAAKREAQAAFGNDGVMLEKLILRPRHVEVQIFGDSHGNVVHLFERDCSLQRRHQKLVEESPAPGLSERLRHILGIAAITAGMAIDYRGAGTVEFILDMDDRDEEGDPRFYFMEMNTRLQVEHPVTEAITGLDLVEWQIRIAGGEMLPLMQDAIECTGHAVEARLYAEVPERGFLPSTGTLGRLRLSDAVRVDTGVEEGDSVSVYYDPMIAKMIAHGPTRAAALDRLTRALDASIVEGVGNNRAFLARLVHAPDFREGRFDTGFLAAHEESLLSPPTDAAWPAAVAAIYLDRDEHLSGPGFATPFRLNLPVVRHAALYSPDGRQFRTASTAAGVAIDGGTPHAVHLRREELGWHAIVDQQSHHITILACDGSVEIREAGREWRFLTRNPLWDGAPPPSLTDGQITAPMPGKILSVHVRSGERVSAGDRLLVMEAMKMEHRIVAPFAATIAEIAVSDGGQVQEGSLLLKLEPEAG